ncbi:MAG TPA: glutathione S-transferase [Bdellovibrionales bacterium]|nr:glutathione S-transferase [Pseudobdellovibrionaceae bacterium]HAG91999.1 glutathione S-transferase [Bdellovibrionales bacterium]
MSEPIQLYSLATPNGQKVSIALEEMELPYVAHRIDIMKGEQFAPSFKKINPNSKIPAIIDPKADGGEDFCIFESGAILTYLADKSGKFLSDDPFVRNRTLQWLYFQVGGVGPMFGQFGHFYKYAKEKCKDPYPLERYTKETQRLLGVIDDRLSENSYLAGEELSIADFATFPWVVCLDVHYQAEDHLKLNQFKNVQNWVAKLKSRPALQRGLEVCPI